VAAFSKAIAVKPDFAEAHYALGLTYIALGKNEAAQAQYNLLNNLNEDLAKKLYPKLARHLAPSSPARPPEPEKVAKLDLTVLKNSRYYVADEWIPLKDGKFERGNNPSDNPDFLRVYFEKAALGRLTDNASENAAVIYWYNGGGSGCFYQLGAMIMKDGEPLNISSISLGDRVKIKDISISNEAIVLDMFTHGPKDALANPTVRTINKYKLSKNKLSLISSSVARVQRNDIRQSPTRPSFSPLPSTTAGSRSIPKKGAAIKDRKATPNNKQPTSKRVQTIPEPLKTSSTPDKTQLQEPSSPPTESPFKFKEKSFKY